MSRRLLSVLAGLALAAAVGTTAQAQDSTSIPSRDSSRMQAGMAKADYQSFVTAVNGTSESVAALKAQPQISASDITFVNVRDITQGQSESAVNGLLQPHQADIEELRTTLSSKPDLVNALKNQSPSITPQDVVAADRDGNRWVIYYRSGESPAPQPNEQ